MTKKVQNLHFNSKKDFMMFVVSLGFATQKFAQNSKVIKL